MLLQSDKLQNDSPYLNTNPVQFKSFSEMRNCKHLNRRKHSNTTYGTEPIFQSTQSRANLHIDKANCIIPQQRRTEQRNQLMPSYRPTINFAERTFRPTISSSGQTESNSFTRTQIKSYHTAHSK